MQPAIGMYERQECAPIVGSVNASYDSGCLTWGHIRVWRVFLGKLLREQLIQERPHRKATIDKFKTVLFLLL